MRLTCTCGHDHAAHRRSGVKVTDPESCRSMGCNCRTFTRYVSEGAPEAVRGPEADHNAILYRVVDVAEIFDRIGRTPMPVEAHQVARFLRQAFPEAFELLPRDLGRPPVRHE